MKAVHMNSFLPIGSVADDIIIGEIPSLTCNPPAGNTVIISVKSTSINVDDVALAQDSAGGGWFFHTRKPTPDSLLVGGLEYAGVVLAVGPKTKSLKVGDRVCGIQDAMSNSSTGTWAEQTSAPEGHVVPIPDSVSFLEAATSGEAMRMMNVPLSPLPTKNNLTNSSLRSSQACAPSCRATCTIVRNCLPMRKRKQRDAWSSVHRAV